MSHVHYINGNAYDAAQIQEYLERLSASRSAKRRREAGRSRPARTFDSEIESAQERDERPARDPEPEGDAEPGTRYA